MKKISNYNSPKYESKLYTKIADGIYQTNENHDTLYVTSLSFIQEPEFEEGTNAGNISQYPLEDLLDQFYCHISDFYDELNREDSEICYLEFASLDLDDVKNLRSVIGKHVYNKEDGDYVELVIE